MGGAYRAGAEKSKLLVQGPWQGQDKLGRLGSKEHPRCICKFLLSGQVATQPLSAHPRNREPSSLGSSGCSTSVFWNVPMGAGSALEAPHHARPLALSVSPFQPALGDWPGP